MPYQQLQFRRGTAAQWTAANPVLAAGEMGLETDTTFFKVGDGTTAWSSLSYGPISGIPTDGSITANKLATDAVTTTKIQNNAVTQGKLASTLSGITICTSTTRPASPFTGQAIFETNTNKFNIYNGSSWIGVSTVRKVAAFTASGSWTVPAGVTYAVANIRAAGGGAGTSGSGTGGNSSVAFASGTVTATGGLGANGGYIEAPQSQAGTINSGQGAKFNGSDSSNTTKQKAIAQDGAYIVAGADVTAGASITVTVGSGGTAGTSGAAGGSGYVWIEYEQ